MILSNLLFDFRTEKESPNVKSIPPRKPKKEHPGELEKLSQLANFGK